jgi:hypothetical protein
MRGIQITWLVVLFFAAVIFSGAACSTPPLPEGAARAVGKLYRDYAWEAVIAEPDFSELELFQQSGQVLKQYFDNHLLKLILRDRQCNDENHSVCRLDFSPMWGGQDPQAFDLKIVPTNDPAVVTVEFTYPGDRSHIKLAYHLVNTSKGWRITDIQGLNGTTWSLRKILESKSP